MINKIKILVKFPLDVWLLFITYLPGSVGFKLRYRYWKKQLKYIGKNVRIDQCVYFQNPQFISLDDNCWIDRGVIILAGADKSQRARRYIKNNLFPFEKGMVYIGKNNHIGSFSIISGIGGVYISDDCTFSAGVKLYSFSHHFRSDDFPSDKKFGFGSVIEHSKQYMIEGPVFLDKNVGIALNAVILPGVSIKKDSFVMINSVVTTSFDENSLIAGNPAKRIKERFINT
ncbi:Hexapeptide repeat-containing protein [Desulfonema limicola]|uniref:Hexapeptide repeat-containing protein n=1 Tax=Desulfonema limicola TaxID=45656 RepID=A0A975GJC5_9BACT|nr:acyltransferase [Desulfonema limicola]QTA83262.1 Hexapeptide repeat-containing protein [Desulfonema limicola]